MDPKFPDGIDILVKSFDEIGQVFDMLVDALRHVGLVRNGLKTRIFTTQSQHPAELSPSGIVVEILEPYRAHKWLGCTDGSHGLDLEHHLHGAFIGPSTKPNLFYVTGMRPSHKINIF